MPDTQSRTTRQEYDVYWQNTENIYSWYPTIRHRRRFIINMVQKFRLQHPCTIFDFGCGDGSLLEHLRNTCSIEEKYLGGSDISGKALELARKKLGTAHFFHAAFPKTEQAYDIIICSEVIEHATDYRGILTWIHRHLREEGILILTTQSGRIHASDRYTHHTQHFQKKALSIILRQTGFHLLCSRLWGWPLFTAQKFLTNINFSHVRENYLEGDLSLMKRITFSLAYVLYFLHDFVPLGPQIYIVGKKSMACRPPPPRNS